jgi:hypothetical protein
MTRPACSTRPRFEVPLSDASMDTKEGGREPHFSEVVPKDEVKHFSADHLILVAP